MKQSCLFLEKKNIYEKLGNFFKTSLYNYDQIITVNKSENLEIFKFIVINCFEEILSSSDFY